MVFTFLHKRLDKINLSDDTLKGRKPWDRTWKRRMKFGLPKSEKAEQGAIEAIGISDTPSAASAAQLFGGLRGRTNRVWNLY